MKNHSGGPQHVVRRNPEFPGLACSHLRPADQVLLLRFDPEVRRVIGDIGQHGDKWRVRPYMIQRGLEREFVMRNQRDHHVRPDMVVSLIPHYNRSLKTTLDHVWPDTPFVTVLTDIADYPPHFWIEPQEQHLICGSEMAARQARELGIPADHVLRTSGMILNP